MKTKKVHYLTQYCNLLLEWQRDGINIDNATESQALRMWDLQKKALEQSGLTDNELELIRTCRNYKIYTEVNEFRLKLLRLFR